LLLAIALLRRENAIDYLLDLVQNGESQTSADAVAALAMYEGGSEPAGKARPGALGQSGFWRTRARSKTQATFEAAADKSPAPAKARRPG
jgi:hypothetical protein